MRYSRATDEQLAWAVRRFGPDRAGRELWRRGLVPPIAGASGLAIDTSTPAFVSTGSTAVTTLTTASFTPPVGALLVVGYINGFSVAMPQPSNTGGTVSWDGAVWKTATQNGLAALWKGTVTSSAAMTVSITIASTKAWGFGVVVVTGQAGTQNGLTNSSTGAPSAPSVTLSPLVGANSLVLGAFNNGSNSTVYAPDTNQSQTFNGNAFSFSDASDGAAGWVQYDTRMNLAAGASDTLDTTTSINNSVVAAEILAAGATAAASTPPALVVPNTAVMQSTVW